MSELLTAGDVREASFSKPPIGKRGYHEDEVDQFLDDVVAHLEGTIRLSTDDVRDVRFGRPPWGRRGYNEDEVDTLLNRIIQTVDAGQRR
jgi:DivIVA domain-containing protein